MSGTDGLSWMSTSSFLYTSNYNVGWSVLSCFCFFFMVLMSFDRLAKWSSWGLAKYGVKGTMNDSFVLQGFRDFSP